jgi:hypothetical protein
MPESRTSAEKAPTWPDTTVTRPGEVLPAALRAYHVFVFPTPLSGRRFIRFCGCGMRVAGVRTIFLVFLRRPLFLVIDATSSGNRPYRILIALDLIESEIPYAFTRDSDADRRGHSKD